MNGYVGTTYTEELVLDISFKRLLWILLQFPFSFTSFLFIAKLQRKKKDKEREEKRSPLNHTEKWLGFIFPVVSY